MQTTAQNLDNQTIYRFQSQLNQFKREQTTTQILNNNRANRLYTSMATLDRNGCFPSQILK